MNAVRFAATAVLAVTALSGCRDRTEIVLVVDTDLTVPEELDRVDVVVRGPSSYMTSGTDLWDAATLPLTLGIEAENHASSVSITAIGSVSHAELVRNGVRTEFVEGEIRTLTLLLLRSCAHVTCADDRICVEGSCVAATRPGGSLPPWSGE